MKSRQDICVSRVRVLGALALTLSTLAGCAAEVDLDGYGDESQDEAEAEVKRAGGARKFHVWFLGPNSKWDNKLYGTMQTLAWCEHKGDPNVLQQKINDIPAQQKIMIYLQEGGWLGNCDHSTSPHSFGEFKRRVEKMIPVLDANRERISAIYVFDEPTNHPVGEGDIQQAVNFFAKRLPKIPRFVNWFDCGDNGNFANVSWTSCTKGASVWNARGIGKPMNLFAFNNEGGLGAGTISGRYNEMLSYHYTNMRPPMASFSWWSGGLAPHHDSHQPSGRWYLKALGAAEHEVHMNQRAPFVQLSTGKWFAFFHRPDGGFEFRSNDNAGVNDPYTPLPIGGASAFPLSSWKQKNRIHLVTTGLDGQVYLGGRLADGTWVNWAPLPGFSQGAGRPTIFGNDKEIWVGVMDAANHFWAHQVGTSSWNDLGATAMLPLLKKKNGRIWAFAFQADGPLRKLALDVEAQAQAQVAWSNAVDGDEIEDADDE